MNRTHHSIFNEQTGTYVAVAEHTCLRGKKSKSCVARVLTAGLSTLAAALYFSGSAQAACLNVLQSGTTNLCIDYAPNTQNYVLTEKK